MDAPWAALAEEGVSRHARATPAATRRAGVGRAGGAGRRTADEARAAPFEGVPSACVSQHVYRKQHVVTSVVAVIVDDAERVVLTRRSIAPFRGLWVMPGGKIDLGEPMVRAVHREVREEIGIDVVVGGLVDVFEHLTPGPENDHFVILYYRCKATTHELAPNPAEVAEARWVPRTELGGYPVADGTRHVLGAIFPELGRPEAWTKPER